MNEQLVADLKAARALIDTPEKWIQLSPGGHNYDTKTPGCTCVANAMYFSCGENSVRQNAMLRAFGFDRLGLIWAWNDAPERTHADVMAAFDKAIEKAEAPDA